METATTSVLEQMLKPVSQCFTNEAAKKLIAVRADPKIQRRIERLAEKNTEGKLTESERREYEMYVTASNLIAILKCKAREYLATSE